MCNLRDVQKKIYEEYYEKDSERGLERTFMWFIEEVGELSEAIIKGTRESVEEEIADVFAWLVSLANLLNIDLCDAFIKKYGNLK